MTAIDLDAHEKELRGLIDTTKEIMRVALAAPEESEVVGHIKEALKLFTEYNKVTDEALKEWSIKTRAAERVSTLYRITMLQKIVFAVFKHTTDTLLEIVTGEIEEPEEEPQELIDITLLEAMFNDSPDTEEE